MGSLLFGVRPKNKEAQHTPSNCTMGGVQLEETQGGGENGRVHAPQKGALFGYIWFAKCNTKGLLLLSPLVPNEKKAEPNWDRENGLHW